MKIGTADGRVNTPKRTRPRSDGNRDKDGRDCASAITQTEVTLTRCSQEIRQLFTAANDTRKGNYMARFRGHVGNVTRLGRSDLSASAYGWNIGGRVYVYANDEPSPVGPRGGWRKSREVDNVTLSMDGGTNGAKVPQIVVYANTDGNYSVFVNGNCVATNDTSGGMSEIGRGHTRGEAHAEAGARMAASDV